ncbi:hypothetical protein PILCRDRAFT_820742 [Piloderma croceum F 1598]|uniref:Uncharacterized protein n=1 Tax=Piloderma croceum (strain F 1598) TaxID=765440 RepID=A0A0C3BY97_PILCF|nr:hypothetical protein PILCRDRAFT_820742 [Piloderma croceum F 1598]
MSFIALTIGIESLCLALLYLKPTTICTPEIQSSLQSFIGAPPVVQQVARLGVGWWLVAYA